MFAKKTPAQEGTRPRWRTPSSRYHAARFVLGLGARCGSWPGVGNWTACRIERPALDVADADRCSFLDLWQALRTPRAFLGLCFSIKSPSAG